VGSSGLSADGLWLEDLTSFHQDISEVTRRKTLQYFSYSIFIKGRSLGDIQANRILQASVHPNLILERH
jgi:hypothetical protein